MRNDKRTIVGLSVDYDFFLTDRTLEKEFWNQLDKRHLKPPKIVYNNDHKNAYYFFKSTKLDFLIHFDNHSDCYDKNLSFVTTENWLFKLMQAKPQLKVIWIQNKILAEQIGVAGMEERSIIRSKNWIEPPFCFKELDWQYDSKTKEHFIEANSPQMQDVLKVWTQLDKVIKMTELKKRNVIGCYVSRSPPWTKNRTKQDFQLFLRSAKRPLYDFKR